MAKGWPGRDAVFGFGPSPPAASLVLTSFLRAVNIVSERIRPVSKNHIPRPVI